MFFLFPLLASAEIIDRVVVSAGNQVVTASDLDREIRVAAFLNRAKPDFSPAGKRATAERMVEQLLIRRELLSSRYPLPGPTDVVPALEQFKKDNYPKEDMYTRALAEYGITGQQVQDELLWQRTLLLFIEVRFRPGVQVSDDEIQDYFTRTVEPAARAAHPGQSVALEDFRGQIEESLAGARVDQQVDAWLKEARKTAEVAFHDEAFQ